MRTIGIRAAPKVVTFAVYDTISKQLLNVEEIKVPAAFQDPLALKYIRSNLLDVLREYDVRGAGLRVTEPNARKVNLFRVQIEGVILETFASSDLEKYFIGQISTIGKNLGVDRKQVKPLIDGLDDPGVENWTKMSKEEREAILCAIGAENA